MSVQDTIKQQLADNPVMLYMKGTPQFPQCGFSASAVQSLKACGVSGFGHFNVLSDDRVREGIKAHANWPTIPQLYVQGEFIGGADIVREMTESGELKALLDKAGLL